MSTRWQEHSWFVSCWHGYFWRYSPFPAHQRGDLWPLIFYLVPFYPYLNPPPPHLHSREFGIVSAELTGWRRTRQDSRGERRKRGELGSWRRRWVFRRKHWKKGERRREKEKLRRLEAVRHNFKGLLASEGLQSRYSIRESGKERKEISKEIC